MLVDLLVCIALQAEARPLLMDLELNKIELQDLDFFQVGNSKTFILVTGSGMT